MWLKLKHSHLYRGADEITMSNKKEFSLEDLKDSEKKIGQIFPVIKDQHGNILDGFHRKRVNPYWKETIVNIENPLHSLRIRLHANIKRRDVESKEKEEWVSEARKILQNEGKKGTQEEIAKALGMSQSWVRDYDIAPIQPNKSHQKVVSPTTFFGYNVWGFKDESWRNQIVKGDEKQPDKEFYHGSTPAFIIHQLIKMFKPKTVLDSMAGVGTTGYVCKQYGIECDQFDIYPYPKFEVQECDAEAIPEEKKYSLIFNHIPYLDIVRYGENQNDLSTMNRKEFFDKMERIFKKNHALLEKEGTYVILVGDKRIAGKLYPITARIIILGIDKTDFVLHDIAIKLTAEQSSSGLQEFRASKFGFLAQTYDSVLMFKKE